MKKFKKIITNKILDSNFLYFFVNLYIALFINFFYKRIILILFISFISYFLILLIFLIMSAINGSWIMFVSGFLTFPVFIFALIIANLQNKESNEQKEILDDQKELTLIHGEILKNQNLYLEEIKKLNEKQILILNSIRPLIEWLYKNFSEKITEVLKEQKKLEIDNYSNKMYKKIFDNFIKLSNEDDNLNKKSLENGNIIEEIKK